MSKTNKDLSDLHLDPQHDDALILDSIHRNRILPTTPPSAIPEVPKGFAPTTTTEKSRRLRRLADTLRAEANEALDEVVKNQGTYNQDFGDVAPSINNVKDLGNEIRTTEETLKKLESLMAFHTEKLEILRHDQLEFLGAVNDEYEHRKNKIPALRGRYSRLEKLFSARSDAIAEGIARARTLAAASSNSPKDSESDPT